MGKTENSLGGQLEYFLEMMMVERAASTNTVTAYRTDIGNYLQWLIGEDHPISVNDNAKFLDYITNQLSEYSARTVSRKISAIKQFYQFLVDDGALDSNPVLKVPFPKRERLLPKSLSSNQLEKLFKTAKADDSAEGIRLYSILELLYSTGLRISELVALKTTDLSRYHDDGSLCGHTVIKGKGDKERVIILNEDACNALEAYLQIRNHFIPEAKRDSVTWLFASRSKGGASTPISRQRIGQLLKSLASKAGIDPALLSPHKIRHTFASHMVQNGANIRFVQELMGHADISSTQIYTKVENKEAEDLVLRKHPMAAGDEGNA